MPGSRTKKPEPFAIEREGSWWNAVEFDGPHATNADTWREIDRKRTKNDQAEDLRRAVRLLNDSLDELDRALRNPGEYPLPRATLERCAENMARAAKLLSEIEVE